jgi:hypothetical protein
MCQNIEFCLNTLDARGTKRNTKKKKKRKRKEENEKGREIQHPLYKLVQSGP